MMGRVGKWWEQGYGEVHEAPRQHVEVLSLEEGVGCRHIEGGTHAGVVLRWFVVWCVESTQAVGGQRVTCAALLRQAVAAVSPPCSHPCTHKTRRIRNATSLHMRSFTRCPDVRGPWHNYHVLVYGQWDPRKEQCGPNKVCSWCCIGIVGCVAVLWVVKHAKGMGNGACKDRPRADMHAWCSMQELALSTSCLGNKYCATTHLALVPDHSSGITVMLAACCAALGRAGPWMCPHLAPGRTPLC